jgi:hypothetical protein
VPTVPAGNELLAVIVGEGPTMMIAVLLSAVPQELDTLTQ